MRIDVITLFPAIFPGPLAESIPGRALERGLAELHAHDLRAVGPGPAPLRRRLPLRRRAGHDPAARAGRRGARRVAPAGSGAVSHPARSRRRALPPGAGPGPLPRASTSCSSVLATRASTIACARWSTSSSPSATSSSPAVRSRRWRSSTPCCDCCPAPSTRPPPRRSRSRTACSSTRSGRGPPEFRGRAVPDILRQRQPRRGRRLAPRAGPGADPPEPTRPAPR